METKNWKGQRVLALPSVGTQHCGGYRGGFELLDMTRGCQLYNKLKPEILGGMLEEEGEGAGDWVMLSDSLLLDKH